MADAASQSQQSVAFVVESTRGTTPTNPAYTYNRIRTGTTFTVTKAFEQSTEVRSDREPGARVGGVSGWTGQINSFLCRETYLEQLLKSALSGDYAALAPSAVSVAWNSGAKTATRSSGSFTAQSAANRFEVGDLLFAAGTAANQTQLNGAVSDTTGLSLTVDTVDATTVLNSGGGYIKIDNEIMKYSARTSTSITLTQRGALGTTAATHADNAPVLVGREITAMTATVLTFGNDTVATESAVSTTFTTTTRILVPGTTRYFGTFEQKFGDIALYEIFKGGEVNTAQFNMPTSGEVTIDFNVLGTRYATGQVSGSTYTAAAGRTPFAASVVGSSLTINGSAPTGCITNVQFSANNNRALKNGVGEQFACFVEEGTRQIDGTMGLYLVDGSNQTLFQAETRSRLRVTAASADLDEYDFIWPRIVFTDLPRQVDGQSFVENASFSAEYDATALTAFYLRSRILGG